jgi:hypothetical protein
MILEIRIYSLDNKSKGCISIILRKIKWFDKLVHREPTIGWY